MLKWWGVRVMSHVKIIGLFIEYYNLSMFFWNLEHASLIFVKVKRSLFLFLSFSMIFRIFKSELNLFLWMDHLRKVGGHDFLFNLVKCELVPNLAFIERLFFRVLCNLSEGNNFLACFVNPKALDSFIFPLLREYFLELFRTALLRTPINLLMCILQDIFIPLRNLKSLQISSQI
jgi:hypothetical protein